MSNKELLLNEYRSKKGLYQSFASKVSQLINDILISKGITISAIPFREKDEDSLSKKISKEGNEEKYQNLTDVTDLAGVRIITYFSDDVDKIATIIEDEFEVDYEKSIDKRKTHDPDRFGYLSLHYIIKLKSNRAELVEYSSYSNLYVEVQVRSILQHAWAEIEHDLGYKSKRGIPKDTRRSFSRLAGMLELTDIEFLRIRNELNEYEAIIPEQIKTEPSKVLIDNLSLKSYILSSEIVNEIALGVETLRPEIEFTDVLNVIGLLIEPLDYNNIETILELDGALNKRKDEIIKFSSKFFQVDNSKKIQIGKDTLIIYFCHLLIAEANDFNLIERYSTRLLGETEDNPVDKTHLANKIYEIYNEIM